MNIIVTGDRGFIGTHLRRRLMVVGHVVYGVDVVEREGVAGFACDIRSPNGLNYLTQDLGKYVAKRPDACVHLAAIASPNVCGKDPSTAFETNVRGTANVLGLCHRLGVKRVVFASSAHVYGISPKYMPTPETHPLALLDTYTTTKILGERLCESFWDNHGLSYCALRFFNVFGPGQSADYFMGRKIEEAKAGKVTMRTPLRDVTKDWINVGDACAAIVKALKSDFVGPVNVGTGVETRLADIADAIARGFGVAVEPEDVGDPGPTRMCADWSRARRVLGWEPTVRFEDGLRALIEEAKR